MEEEIINKKKEIKIREYIKIRREYIKIRQYIKLILRKLAGVFKKKFIKIGGYKLYYDLGNTSEYNANYESNTVRMLRENIKKGSIVVDGGANIGFFTLLLSRLVGKDGKVYAFEPDYNNFKILKKNIKINKITNVIVEKKAISDKTGVDELYICPYDISSHVLYDEGKDYSHNEVKTITLDDYFKNIDVDFIKLDIDGSEARAINGAKNVLKKCKLMIVEYVKGRVIAQGYTKDSFYKLIKSNGFNIRPINEDIRNVKVDNLWCYKEKEQGEAN